MIFKCLKCGGSLDLPWATPEYVRGTSGERGEVAHCESCASPNIWAPFIPNDLTPRRLPIHIDPSLLGVQVSNSTIDQQDSKNSE
jgi:hypothetical protein